MPKIRPIFLLFACSSFALPAWAQDPIVEVKQPAPYFILPTWDGNTLRSSSLKGRLSFSTSFKRGAPTVRKVELSRRSSTKNTRIKD